MRNLKEYIIEGIFDIDDNMEKLDKFFHNTIKKFITNNYRSITRAVKISDKPNKDGKYEVSCDKDVKVKNKKIKSLTNEFFIWTKVDGYFDCRSCYSLESLEGAPKEVTGGFWCDYCVSLESLEGAPEKVGGFSCQECNSLTSLKGAPKEVSWCFDCGWCWKLVSLEGAPEKVGANFNCNKCALLTSLKGAPKEVGEQFICSKPFTEEDVRKISNVKGMVLFH